MKISLDDNLKTWITSAKGIALNESSAELRAEHLGFAVTHAPGEFLAKAADLPGLGSAPAHRHRGEGVTESNEQIPLAKDLVCQLRRASGKGGEVRAVDLVGVLDSDPKWLRAAGEQLPFATHSEIFDAMDVLLQSSLQLVQDRLEQQRLVPTLSNFGEKSEHYHRQKTWFEARLAASEKEGSLALLKEDPYRSFSREAKNLFLKVAGVHQRGAATVSVRLLSQMEEPVLSRRGVAKTAETLRELMAVGCVFLPTPGETALPGEGWLAADAAIHADTPILVPPTTSARLFQILADDAYNSMELDYLASTAKWREPREETETRLCKPAKLSV